MNAGIYGLVELVLLRAIYARDGQDMSTILKIIRRASHLIDHSSYSRTKSPPNAYWLTWRI
jgi:hypothetical protein